MWSSVHILRGLLCDHRLRTRRVDPLQDIHFDYFVLFLLVRHYLSLHCACERTDLVLLSLDGLDHPSELDRHLLLLEALPNLQAQIRRLQEAGVTLSHSK